MGVLSSVSRPLFSTSGYQNHEGEMRGEKNADFDWLGCYERTLRRAQASFSETLKPEKRRWNENTFFRQN